MLSNLQCNWLTSRSNLCITIYCVENHSLRLSGKPKTDQNYFFSLKTSAIGAMESLGGNLSLVRKINTKNITKMTMTYCVEETY